MGLRSHWFIIAYDIRAPKRLQRIYKCLRKKAYALHESVFLYRGTNKELKSLEAEVCRIIRSKVDDVRIYRVSAEKVFICIGRDLIPSGIIIEDFPKFESWNDKNDD